MRRSVNGHRKVGRAIGGKSLKLIIDSVLRSWAECAPDCFDVIR